jgi:hypothetical protein
LFRMGDCFRPMKPQSNPVAGFYPIYNLRIMPENWNCSNRVDDEVDGSCVASTWINAEQVSLMANSLIARSTTLGM